MLLNKEAARTLLHSLGILQMYRWVESKRILSAIEYKSI